MNTPASPSPPSPPSELESIVSTTSRWTILAVLALTLLGLFLAFKYAQPVPPKRVVMTTGTAGGGYHTFGEAYRAQLARHGITLELMPSAGAVENLERLKNRASGVDLALFQSGLPSDPAQKGIASLGHMFYEPIWIFTNGSKPLSDIRELAGLRVAVGVKGGGTHAVAMDLLKEYQVDQLPTQMFELAGAQAAEALEKGTIDAAFFILSPKAPVALRLLKNPKIHLASLARANAMVRRSPYLQRVDLPAGSVDPVADLPPRDVSLVATTAVLLAREDLHPMVIDLMVEAAREVHSPGSVLSGPGHFPNTEPGQFPLSSEAARFYKEGPGFLRQYLPLSTAIWGQRMLFIGLPLLAVLGPIAHFAPIVWRWQMRRRIYRWYGELRSIEDAVMAGRGDTNEQLRRLHLIDERLSSMGTPLAFSADLYSLRAHLHFVHNLLEERMAGGSRARLAAASA